MRWSPELALAAKSHVDDIGPKGLMSHESSNGTNMQKRLAKFGRFQKTMGENLSFGEQTGEDIVMQLFIDDGVKDRGHRENLMNDDFRVVGCFSGPHKQYEIMNCQDFAFDFHKKDK